MRAISPRKAPLTLHTLRIHSLLLHSAQISLLEHQERCEAAQASTGQNCPASSTPRSHSPGKPPQHGQLRDLAPAAPRRPLGHGVSAARSCWHKALLAASAAEMQCVLHYLHKRQKAFRSFGNY